MSSSVLLSVSVWLVLPLTIWAVLVSVAALVKAPVTWLPLSLEELLSVSSSVLLSLSVWLVLPLTMCAVLLSAAALAKAPVT